MLDKFMLEKYKIPNDVYAVCILPYLDDRSLVNLHRAHRFFRDLPVIQKALQKREILHRIRQTLIIPEYLIQRVLSRRKDEALEQLLTVLKCIPYDDSIRTIFSNSANASVFLKALLGDEINDFPTSTISQWNYGPHHFYILAGHYEQFQRFIKLHIPDFTYMLDLSDDWLADRSNVRLADKLRFKDTHLVGKMAAMGGHDDIRSSFAKDYNFPDPKNFKFFGVYYTALLESAIEGGQLKLIKLWLPSTTKIVFTNQIKAGMISYIEYAAMCGHFDIVDYLTALCPDIQQKAGFFLMIGAARHDDIDRCRKYKHIFNLHVNHCLEDKTNLYTHVLEGGSLKVLEYLKTKPKCDLKQYFEKNRIGTYIAAYHGRTKLCSELIDTCGLDKNHTDEQGLFFVHDAARGGHWDCYMKLITKYFPDDLLLATKSGFTAIHIAAEAKRLWFLKQAVSYFGASCLEAKAKNGDTVLHRAMGSYNMDIIDWLVDEHGFKFDTKNEEGDTTMHSLVKFANKYIYQVGNKFLVALVAKRDRHLLELRNKMGETVLELLPQSVKDKFAEPLRLRGLP